MALTKLTTDLIDGTIVTSVNGSTGAVTLETGTDWQATPKTADFTAVAGEGYFVDTTSTAITVTLPSSPSAGEEVSIIDYGLNASTNNITITSSDNIEGAADDLTLSTDKVSKTLVYSDATKGWLVTTEAAGVAAVPDLTVSYLVVGGGGAGGASGFGGGGGAGGLKTNFGGTAVSLITSTNYLVTIGAGGSGGGTSTPAPNGNSSDFNGIVAIGGGGGGGASQVGGNGASGGGGGGDQTTSGGTGSDGNNGGLGYDPSPESGGGGGGFGAVGQNGNATQAGDGGAGVQNNIDGNNSFYAAGGGGGVGRGDLVSGISPAAGGSSIGGDGGINKFYGSGGSTGASPTAGTANTGSGGGGGSSSSNSVGAGGANGGSGIVILRYPNSFTISGLSGNTTIVGSDKVTTFTNVGTGNIQFNL